MGILSNIKNYMFPTPQNPLSDTPGEWKKPSEDKKMLRNYITKVQLQRLRHDIQLWREAVMEAEQAWFPHRVRMQRMFLDTILNGHVAACMTRRKNLTLLKDFKICDDAGVENEQWTHYFKKQWFSKYCEYVLDAQFFGYSLIALGDMTNDDFPELTTIRRFNISPDRLHVTSYVYSLSGAQFLEDPYKDWHVWVATPTEIGISLVGYGLLYKVAMYEIICRNTLGFNTDAAEIFGQPIRIGRTNKTDEAERGEFEQMLSQLGSSAWALMDPNDVIELVESKGNGQGFKIYESLEKRCEQKISKLLLGHADALDSVPGKLGGGNGEESPVKQALEDCQSIDSRMLTDNVNGELLPRLRKFGVALPDGLHFEICNDSEQAEQREREDKSNKATADIAVAMKQAGLQMDAAYFEERTGIPTKAIEVTQIGNEFSKKIQNKLNRLYGDRE